MIRARFLLGTGTAVALFLAAGSAAYAADDSGNTPQTAAPVFTPWSPLGGTDNTLTWKGLTLFGSVDVGIASQTRGAEVNLDSPQGLNYTLGKSSSSALTQLAPNGLSPSTVGLKGDFGLDQFGGAQAVSAIFRLEAGYNPLSLHLDNGPQSLVDNNGRSLAQQTANSDSNQAGQIFNTAGFVGLQAKTYGALTFGRQTGILADRLIEYDPNGASYAFSAVAGSNTIRGMGASQDARLDSSFKYFNQTGPFRYGALYQLSGTQYALFIPDGVSGSATQVNLGGDYKNFSADLLYGKKHDAIVASSLTSAQMLTNPANSLAATVSDNTSYTVLGRYKFDKATAYAGFEQIQFSNPSSPLANDSVDIGGYELSVLTQNAYNRNKVLNVYWTGVKYAFTPKLDLTGAYYAYAQNSYATGSHLGCSSTASSGCSGTFNAESFAAVYKFTTHVDVYGGVMRSAVDNGLASGYLSPSNITTMIGTRVTF